MVAVDAADVYGAFAASASPATSTLDMTELATLYVEGLSVVVAAVTAAATNSCKPAATTLQKTVLSIAFLDSKILRVDRR